MSTTEDRMKLVREAARRWVDERPASIEVSGTRLWPYSTIVEAFLAGASLPGSEGVSRSGGRETGATPTGSGPRERSRDASPPPASVPSAGGALVDELYRAALHVCCLDWPDGDDEADETLKRLMLATDAITKERWNAKFAASVSDERPCAEDAKRLSPEGASAAPIGETPGLPARPASPQGEGGPAETGPVDWVGLNALFGQIPPGPYDVLRTSGGHEVRQVDTDPTNKHHWPYRLCQSVEGQRATCDNAVFSFIAGVINAWPEINASRPASPQEGEGGGEEGRVLWTGLDRASPRAPSGLGHPATIPSRGARNEGTE